MKKSMLLAGAALLLTAATPALAQVTIAPGMTTTQVRERFGAPVTTRAQGDWTYWYYLNGCPVRCGSDDVVFFQNDRVVAAVLRTARRRFAGPAADDALGAAADADERGGRVDAPADEPPAEVEGRARVGGVRVEGATPPADVVTTPAPRMDAPVPVNAPREGQPGEPSTIVITQPDPPPADGAVPPVPVNQAREGRPGEPSTIIISTPPPDTNPAPAAGTNPPDVDGPLPQTGAPGDPAENTEAADTRGETSVDRKNRRVRQDRANEPTATERARRNDAKNP
ncbi:MAG TPA: hypothetical protein VF006_27040 [Longimicrobium sp.]